MRNICILVCLLLTVPAVAQRQFIDSINSVLNIAPAKDKPALYVALAEEYRIISGDTTIMYAHIAIKEARKRGDRLSEAEALVELGAVERDRGEYAKALEYILDGLKILEALNAEEELAKVYNSIGIIYKKMRRWDEALVYYKKANVLAKKYNRLEAASYTYNNIGTIYLEKEAWQLVLDYYDSALRYAKMANSGRAMATVLSNLGDTYKAHKKFDTALATFKLCLQYDKANEDKYGIFMSYFQIARVYVDLGQYELGIKYADSAEVIAIQEQFSRERIDLYGWLTNMEEGRKDFEKALFYFRKSRFLKDTLLTETTAKQVTELQTQYETQKKEQQIILQSSELSRKNYIIFGISGVLIMGTLLGFSYYRRYKLQQQANLQQAVMRQQELATQAVIEAEERERKRIAGDLHDGVGQIMSAARMNLSAIGNDIYFSDEQQRNTFDKAVALVDEGCREVRNVSHNIMPNALLKNGLANAVRDFIQKIDHRMLEVNLYVDGFEKRLSSNTEIVLYRVVQECVNNVIRHSGANSFDITLLKDDDGINITIEDNGKGFDTRDKEKFEGIGLKNMQTRVHYLKGTIEWDSAPGKGTVVSIHVPGAE